MNVEIATEASDELVEGLNHLLPQLSTNATPLTIQDVNELIASPSATVFVARDEGRIVGAR